MFLQRLDASPYCHFAITQKSLNTFVLKNISAHRVAWFHDLNVHGPVGPHTFRFSSLKCEAQSPITIQVKSPDLQKSLNHDSA